MRRYWYLAATIIVLQLLSWLTSYFVTQDAVSSWYPDIAKSALNPPNWVFAPVWFVLYTMLGVALWRLWLARGLSAARTALGLFLVQLTLNYSWSFIFFGMAAFAPALIVLFGMIALTILVMMRAWTFDRMIVWLTIPYLAWISFAAWLNFAIMRLN